MSDAETAAEIACPVLRAAEVAIEHCDSHISQFGEQSERFASLGCLEGVARSMCDDSCAGPKNGICPRVAEIALAFSLANYTITGEPETGISEIILSHKVTEI